jgi:hypothetical protein
MTDQERHNAEIEVLAEQTRVKHGLALEAMRREANVMRQRLGQEVKTRSDAVLPYSPTKFESLADAIMEVAPHTKFEGDYAVFLVQTRFGKVWKRETIIRKVGWLTANNGPLNRLRRGVFERRGAMA